MIALVPHAKPRTVASAPPVAVIFPFNVAPVVDTDEAKLVVTVGGSGETMPLIAIYKSGPVGALAVEPFAVFV
jgi:hypothetical protein